MQTLSYILSSKSKYIYFTYNIALLISVEQTNKANRVKGGQFDESLRKQGLWWASSVFTGNVILTINSLFSSHFTIA